MGNQNKSKPRVEHSPYFQLNLFGLPSKISNYVRKKMFESLIKLADPAPETTVLDVGVTCDRREDSNFFEKLYPYPHMITAMGTENCSFLEKDFPGLRFFNADSSHLPFEDRVFDLAVCFATIEHVGNRQRQEALIRELCRVSHGCCITTPNRWYPLEFHTLIPFIHWLPPRLFRGILRLFNLSFFAREENLNLLSKRSILKMLPADKKVYIKYFKLFGVVSNLMFYISDR